MVIEKSLLVVHGLIWCSNMQKPLDSSSSVVSTDFGIDKDDLGKI